MSSCLTLNQCIAGARAAEAAARDGAGSIHRRIKQRAAVKVRHEHVPATGGVTAAAIEAEDHRGCHKEVLSQRGCHREALTPQGRHCLPQAHAQRMVRSATAIEKAATESRELDLPGLLTMLLAVRCYLTPQIATKLWMLQSVCHMNGTFPGSPAAVMSDACQTLGHHLPQHAMSAAKSETATSALTATT